ncbi:hypothetical protein ACIQK5_14490 [Streptomyces virginiae]|uniref:hypothetical protein n=1 Tax=Streptomyces virginiae TaxID=1961 RepID=UPI003812114F
MRGQPPLEDDDPSSALLLAGGSGTALALAVARLLGDVEAIALLREFAARGTRMVRMVHDRSPS